MKSKPRRWLTIARKSRCLRQSDVAKAVNISRQTYSRYESGSRTPRPSIAKKIADYLMVSKEHFFWDE